MTAKLFKPWELRRMANDALRPGLPMLAPPHHHHNVAKFLNDWAPTEPINSIPHITTKEKKMRILHSRICSDFCYHPVHDLHPL